MRVLKTFVLAAVALTGASAQQPDWSFAHPGATLVGGVRLSAMLQSSILNKLIEQYTKDPQAAAMVALAKDRMGEISEIRFSVNDGEKKNDPDLLALIIGKVNEAEATALLSASQTKTSVRRIDENTLLIGNPASLDKAVFRMNNPVPVDNEAVTRGKALAGYDLWIAGRLPAMQETAIITGMVDGLALGFSIQDDFRMELALDTASPKMAQDLIKAAQESQKKQPSLAGTFEAEADGATARIRFSMDSDHVFKAIQDGVNSGLVNSQISGLMGSGGSANKPPASAAPPKPQRQTIVIYGLDDGPREIHPQQH